jgi:hypothetical protein
MLVIFNREFSLGGTGFSEVARNPCSDSIFSNSFSA